MAKRAALSTPDPGSPAANRATWLLQKPKVNAVSFTLTDMALGTTPDDERNQSVADAMPYVARFRVAKPGCRTAKRAALSTPDPGSPAANRATWLLHKPMVNAVSFTLT